MEVFHLRKNNKTKNVTFSIPVDLIEKYKKYADGNEITSMNAAVREALTEYSVKLEKEILYKKMKDAAQDKMFMNDLKESMKDFEDIDNEMGKGVEKW